MIQKPTAAEIRRFSQLFEPKTYFEPEGTNFSREDLDPGPVSDTDYLAARRYLVRTCVDALLACENDSGDKGILLITRNGNPAKGQLWPIGGGIRRGIFGSKNALRFNAQREAGVGLDDIVYLGSVDFAWATTPGEMPETGKGIRDVGLMYFAEAIGDLSFRNLDNNPLIVTPEMWERKEGKLANLHQYVDENLDMAMTLLVDKYDL